MEELGRMRAAEYTAAGLIKTDIGAQICAVLV